MIVTGYQGSIWPPVAAATARPPAWGGGLSVAGVVGSIRWGYYTAAGIHGYVIAPCDRRGARWDLVATVLLADAFKMAQRPLTFVAVRSKKGLDGRCVVKAEWRFAIESCSLVDHRLTARLLGPPEET